MFIKLFQYVKDSPIDYQHECTTYYKVYMEHMKLKYYKIILTATIIIALSRKPNPMNGIELLKAAK